MRLLWLRPVAILLALSALLAIGCSRDPLRPLQDSSDTPARMGGIETVGDTLALPVVFPLDSTHVMSARDSLTIIDTKSMDGLSDAVMRAGRVKLEIPAGAIRGASTIQMRASPNGKHVQLEILPADRNGFDIPVQLSANFAGASTAVLEELAFFWIDPATGDWVLVEGSTVDLVTGEVSAPLSHFSEYRVGNRFLGKAGW